MGQFFLQLYGSGKDFTERVFIRFPILNLKPFNKFILFLSNRTHPVIQYRNTRDSHSIRVFVDSCTGKIRVTKKSNYVRFFSSTLRNSSTLLKYFLSKQFLFLPLIASKVGAGYHLGSSLEFGKHLNIDGSIINLPHVFVVDASSLQDLSPGGLVYHSMLNAMEVTENSIGGS